jgi:hypothetical protein
VCCAGYISSGEVAELDLVYGATVLRGVGAVVDVPVGGDEPDGCGPVKSGGGPGGVTGVRGVAG